MIEILKQSVEMNKMLVVGEKFRNCNLHFKKAYLNPLKSEKIYIKQDLN